MFGAIDPLNVKALTSPAANQPWTPGQSLPQVSAPEPLAAVPNAALSGPLSLADLTDLALLLNPRTRQAWFQARAEAATVGIENADNWPTITGLYSHRIGRVISGTTGLPVPVQTFYGPNVSLSYILYDFGQREADIEAANYRLLAANLSQNRVLQEVANQVEQAYYRVLAFDYLVRASRESLKNFETALLTPRNGAGHRGLRLPATNIARKRKSASRVWCLRATRANCPRRAGSSRTPWGCR